VQAILSLLLSFSVSFYEATDKISVGLKREVSRGSSATAEHLVSCASRQHDKHTMRCVCGLIGAKVGICDL